ncbi:MAG: hypothetical protein ACREOY_00630, partial [Candidatus Dormibacteraceae bacterium]
MIQVYTLNSLGTIELLMGDIGGRDKLLRSLDMAEELGLDEEVGRAYLNLAEVLAHVRLYDGFLDFVRKGEDYCSQHGLELWRMWLLTSEALAPPRPRRNFVFANATNMRPVAAPAELRDSREIGFVAGSPDRLVWTGTSPTADRNNGTWFVD